MAVDGFGNNAGTGSPTLAGFRSWKVTADGWLRSCQYGDTIWGPDINTFRCMSWPLEHHLVCRQRVSPVPTSASDGTLIPSHVHTIEAGCYRQGRCGGSRVSLNCDCGFWCFTDPDYVRKGGWFAFEPGLGIREADTSVYVHGAVYGGGSYVWGPYGFRCSKAIVAALILPPTVGNATLVSLPGDTPAEEIPARATAFRQQYARDLADRLREHYPDVLVLPSIPALLDAFDMTDTREFLAANGAAS
jgi:hypothetical protein